LAVLIFEERVREVHVLSFWVKLRPRLRLLSRENLANASFSTSYWETRPKAVSPLLEYLASTPSWLLGQVLTQSWVVTSARLETLPLK